MKMAGRLSFLLLFVTAFSVPHGLHALSSPDAVDDAVSAAKKTPRNKVLNRQAGDALREAGRWEESLAYYAKGDNIANLGAAESAYYLYDFDKGRELLDAYLDKRTAAEQSMEGTVAYGIDSTPVEWSKYLGDRIDIGRSMLDRVEKIQIIDSINVPAETFYRFVSLARSAGSLRGNEIVERVVSENQMDSLGLVELAAPAFISEQGNDVIWTGGASDGGSRIYESVRLADGSWDHPSLLFDYAGIFGNDNGSSVVSPFLLPDGITLYFAADGAESLGGLDIFMSRRDDDGFLQPSNIGMPYNSPYNDYLYAVDESTGAGWWVTDRNGIEDSVTVYTFVPQDLRINYDVDTPSLVSLAKVESIRDTWAPDANYESLRRTLSRAREERMLASGSSDSREFDFALPDGRVVHRMSDFRTALARKAMQDYLQELAVIAVTRKNLEAMRRSYADGDKSRSSAILNEEQKLERLQSELVELRNRVVTSEM